VERPTKSWLQPAVLRGFRDEGPRRHVGSVGAFRPGDLHPPGVATLEGWGPVASSFFALFQGGQQIQFVLTRERVIQTGDTAWVSLDENLLGDQGGVTVATINIFVRHPGSDGWRLICHHGSVVQAAAILANRGHRGVAVVAGLVD